MRDPPIPDRIDGIMTSNTDSPPPPQLLTLPMTQRDHLEPFLPPRMLNRRPRDPSPLPHLTLTYAASLDAQVAVAPGQQTALSGAESKAMTHYLRSRHDAILVGANTAIVDNPSLNCRFALETGGPAGMVTAVGLDAQPVPVILDPSARWDPVGGTEGSGERRVVRLAKEGRGKGVFWVVEPSARARVNEEKEMIVRGARGEVVVPGRELKTPGGGVDWRVVLECLAARGVESVMVEGGARVIEDLLKEENQKFISSVIITIAPVWLGSGGVAVCPPKSSKDRELGRLEDVKWLPMGNDVVMAGKFKV